jgi:hypothetical protein
MADPAPALCATPERSPATTVERFVVDVSAERQAANLRLLAAAIALLGGLWLAGVAQALWLRGVGVTGCVFAVLWARRHLKQRRGQVEALATDAHDYLELGEHHLAVREGAQARSLPLSSIAAVEIDDDRLVVVLRLHAGEPWLIEPRYQGLGLRELAERLHQAVAAERTRASR